jgi:signal transduction histidine kinase
VDGQKADPRPEPVIVTIEALRAQIDTLQAQVRTATAELETARHRQQLVGHEVRTPLTVVLGVLSTLQHPHLTEAERTRLETRALAHAQRLRFVIDDLMAEDAPVRTPLPRSRLETVLLAPLLRNACDAVAARDAGVDVQPGQLIATAPLRLETIVSRLVASAMTHGDGRVELAARTVDHAVLITVADRGPGLRGGDPEELFAPFAPDPAAGAAPGSAFDLYLVRLLARTLGGDVALRDGDPGLVASVLLPQRRSDDPRGDGREPPTRAEFPRPATRRTAIIPR